MTRPRHLKALELDYDGYIALNGGEHCGVCGRERKEGGRRLHRDHGHRSGKPRGLLCHRCNRVMWPWVDIPWLLLAIAYLRRSEDREAAERMRQTAIEAGFAAMPELVADELERLEEQSE